MVKRAAVFLLLILVLAAGCRNQEEARVDTEDDIKVTESAEDLAVRFMELITTGEYQKLVDAFRMSSAMERAVSADLYKTAWEGMTAQNGAYVSYKLTETATAADFTIIPVLVTCTQSKIIANIVFDKDRLLSGFNFAPYAEPEAPPITVSETEIEVVTGAFTMPGRLVMPGGEEPAPLVIFASGSGPTDMDSTLGPNKPLRDIAYGLAEQGVASIRFTKRTAIYGAAMGENVTIGTEYLEDLQSAWELAHTFPGVDGGRVFFLGHSLGGNIIPMLAGLIPDAAGYIIMAGNVTPVEELMLVQYKHLLGKDGEISEDDVKLIDTIEAGLRNIEGLTAESELSPADLLNAPKSYWLSLGGYDPLAAAKLIEDRLLILQGEKDYQVTMDEFAQWQEALPDAKFISYPELNHLFMKSNDTFDSREYTQAQHVDNGVIRDIAQFINGGIR